MCFFFFLFFIPAQKGLASKDPLSSPEHPHAAAAQHADLSLLFSPFCRRLVTRVVNTYGPQTRSGGGQGEQQVGPITRHCGNTAIEERLQNIETHLKLPEGQRTRVEMWKAPTNGCSSIKECILPATAGPVPLSVYQRLKKLEDRILELEGLSPEYFQSTVSICTSILNSFRHLAAEARSPQCTRLR